MVTYEFGFAVTPFEKKFDEKLRTLTVKGKLHKHYKEQYIITNVKALDVQLAKAIVKQWNYAKYGIKAQLDRAFSMNPYSPEKGVSPWKVKSTKAVGNYAELTLVTKTNMALNSLKPETKTWPEFLESLMSLEDPDSGYSRVLDPVTVPDPKKSTKKKK